MPIIEYRAQEFETTHERQFIDEFVARLNQEYPNEDETVILLENYICSSNQIDATVLKKDGIIVLEFKNYGGEILFSENGDWTANDEVIKGGRDGRNPCQQVRAYKYSLMNFLKDHADKILTQSREIEWGHVSGMVIFHQTIQFDKGTVPQPMRPWFQVTDIEGSIKAIKTVTSSKLFLSDEELQRIPILLGLQAVGEDVPAKVSVDFVVTHDAQAEPVEIPTIVPKASARRKPRETRTERILDYYLRCLELEDLKRSELRDKADIVMWLPSEAPNLLKDRLKTIRIEKEHTFFRTIMNEEKRERPRSLFFGFPVIKTSEDSGKILPIFICQLQYEESSKGPVLKRIPVEDYVINKTVFQHVGINTPEENEAASAEILQLATLEERIECLRTKYHLAIPSKNRGIVFINEPSNFTHNLVEELGKLISPSNLKSLESTPAQFLINNDHIEEKHNKSSESLLEVFPMNDAQRNSVRRAFNEQVTVVTGPPGTGKSQVVLNIFANAIIQSKTVLFASKINNAVDVVNERFSKYVIDEDLLVRIGALTQMKLIKEGLKGLSKRILNGQLKVDETEVEKAKTQFWDAESTIDKGLAELEELRVLPTNIAESEKRYNDIVQNNKFEIAAFVKEKEQLESNITELLKSIPPKVQHAIYSDRKRPALRRRAIEQLALRANHLLTKEGLTLFERIGRWLVPSHFIKEMKDALSIQEKNIPTELLNWLDLVSPDTSTFEGLFKRSQTILRLLGWDDDIQSVREIETRIDAIEKTSESKHHEFNVHEEQLRLQIAASHERCKQLEREKEGLRDRIEKAGKEKITSARKYVDVQWKQRISSEKAGTSIGTLANYFLNPAAIASSTDTFTKALKYLPLWSVTNLAVRNGLPLRPGIFDLLVVDEAASCDIPSAIPLFFRCKKVIVIGDPMQLKHISCVSDKEDDRLAKDSGCEDFSHRYSSESLYDRMDYVATNSGKTVEFLEEHFRCQEKIIQFSNIFIYLPRIGRELVVKTQPLPHNSPATLTWVNLKGRIPVNSKKNPLEVRKILDILKTLVPRAMENNSTIGVTTPFRNQADEIIQIIPSSYKNIVTADTVNKFQGNEKDIMIFSPVISDGATKGMISFINILAPQLLNVAVTRARNRLIVVGDFDACFQAGGLLKRLAVYMRENGELIP